MLKNEINFYGKYFIILLALLLILTVQSCRQSSALFNENEMYNNSPEFNTQGEQDRYYITKIFECKYESQSYPKYTGQITYEYKNNLIYINFDSIVVCINKADSSYLVSARKRMFFKKTGSKIF